MDCELDSNGCTFILEVCAQELEILSVSVLP